MPPPPEHPDATRDSNDTGQNNNVDLWYPLMAQELFGADTQQQQHEGAAQQPAATPPKSPTATQTKPFPPTPDMLVVQTTSPAPPAPQPVDTMWDSFPELNVQQAAAEPNCQPDMEFLDKLLVLDSTSNPTPLNSESNLLQTTLPYCVESKTEVQGIQEPEKITQQEIQLLSGQMGAKDVTDSQIIPSTMTQDRTPGNHPTLNNAQSVALLTQNSNGSAAQLFHPSSLNLQQAPISLQQAQPGLLLNQSHDTNTSNHHMHHHQFFPHQQTNQAIQCQQLGMVPGPTIAIRRGKKPRNKARKWSPDEQQRFEEGLDLYGRDWEQIARHVGTRDISLIRSHAQKHFIKLAKLRHPLPRRVAESGTGYTLSGNPLRADGPSARSYLTGISAPASGSASHVTTTTKAHLSYFDPGRPSSPVATFAPTRSDPSHIRSDHVSERLQYKYNDASGSCWPGLGGTNAQESASICPTQALVHQSYDIDGRMYGVPTSHGSPRSMQSTLPGSAANTAFNATQNGQSAL